MAKKGDKKENHEKENALAIVSPVSPVHEDNNGQYSLFPIAPDNVLKGWGPVFDILTKDASELFDDVIDVVLDDSAERPEQSIPIQTRVMLSYEGIEYDIQGRSPLTAFDREVLDAVASLYQVGSYMTPAMIYRVMMGKRNSVYVTEGQRARVTNSIQKMGFSRITITLTDMREKGSPIKRELTKMGAKAEYSGYLIAYDKMTVIKGGHCVECFRILNEPAIIQYGATIGKLTEFPLELMDTSINKTERNIVLQSFLLRKIAEMYRDKDARQIIYIDELYTAIGVEGASKQQKAKCRALAATVLDDWVKKGFIKGYKVKRAGQVVAGYQIILQSHGMTLRHPEV